MWADFMGKFNFQENKLEKVYKKRKKQWKMLLRALSGAGNFFLLFAVITKVGIDWEFNSQ